MDPFLAHLSEAQGEVLVSYFVRRPSSVRPQLFKRLLLLYYWFNFDETSQEWSLGGPLQKLLKEFHSMQNSGFHGNQ